MRTASAGAAPATCCNPQPSQDTAAALTHCSQAPIDAAEEPLSTLDTVESKVYCFRVQVHRRGRILKGARLASSRRQAQQKLRARLAPAAAGRGVLGGFLWCRASHLRGKQKGLANGARACRALPIFLLSSGGRQRAGCGGSVSPALISLRQSRGEEGGNRLGGGVTCLRQG